MTAHPDTAAMPSTQRSLELGPVHVETWEADEHRLAHYMVFRVNPRDGSRTLLASGSEHDLASCREKAEMAARRAKLNS